MSWRIAGAAVLAASIAVSAQSIPVADTSQTFEVATVKRNVSGGWAGGRLVIDRTGLTGPYDLDLQWTPDQQALAGGAPGAQADGTSLFAALREQLGLKLEPPRTTAEVLVIESGQLPSED